MRNSAKLTGLVALVAIGGAIGVNCSGNKGSSEGTVKIAVVNAASEGVLSVSYIIHAGTPVPPGPVIPDATGTINVSDPNSTPSVDQSFPASTGDTVTMTATGTGGVQCTGTSAPFPVTAGGVSTVSVTITCPNGTPTPANQNNGDVVVTGTFVSTGDNCPLLTSWVASPLQTSAPGGVVTLGGTASDADGNTLSFTWTASAGSFGGAFPAASAATTYACPSVPAGTTQAETLSLSVNDGAGCVATLPNAITISCVGVTVATGTGGTTGAAGAPPTGGTTGTGGVAGTTGTGGVAGTTGTGGVAGTGGTTGAAGAGGTTGAGGSVPTFPSTAQITCEEGGAASGTICFGVTGLQSDGVHPLAGFGCAGFTGAQLTSCLALQQCLDGQACIAQIGTANASNPGDYPYNDDATPCLCGTAVTKAACLASTTFAGVCATQFANAAGGASLVVGHFFDTTLPIGVGVNLLTCDVDATCIPASGLPGSGM